ncbi:MAG TPA: CPBP family intramembrane glutamic endopeptidase, partial [Microlunatus sp.]
MIAAVICTLAIRNRDMSVLRSLGITPIRPIRQLLGWCAFAFVIFLVLGFLAPLVAGALGVIDLDLAGFSGLREAIIERAPGAADQLSGAGFPWLAFLIAAASVIGLSFPLALPLMIGEEIGWRGFLLPRLMRFGIWPALLISGGIHAIWHGPQLLIQYRSGAMGIGALLIFGVGVIAFGVLLGLVRVWSGSVWPAVIAHAANNVVAQIGFLTLTAAGSRTDPLWYSGGVGGLIGAGLIMAFVVGLLQAKVLRDRTATVNGGRA